MRFELVSEEADINVYNYKLVVVVVSFSGKHAESTRETN